MKWESLSKMDSRKYICGYCGESISSENGYFANEIVQRYTYTYGQIYICHNCERPTFFDVHGNQTPGAFFGNLVKDIPDDNIKNLYEEARKCTGAKCYTAAVLCCRKLLMT